jgi:hypothetical protein
MERGLKAGNSSRDSHHPWLPNRRFQENGRIGMAKKRKMIATEFHELGTEIFQTRECIENRTNKKVSKIIANRETSTGPSNFKN